MATLQLFVTLVNPISSHASRPLFANTQESLWLRPRTFLASSRPVVSRAYRLRSSSTLYLRCGGDDSGIVRWCSHAEGEGFEPPNRFRLPR